MKSASGELVTVEEAKIRRRGWPPSRWLLLIVLVLAGHVALIFAFGTRKTVAPPVVTNFPKLELADGAGVWLELNDPTLFALPSHEGFAGSAWLEPPSLHVPANMLDWTEKPRWLELSNNAANLGGALGRFMQTNRFVNFQFRIEPPPQFSEPVAPLEPAFARNSVLRLEGDLVKRPLLTSMKLPSWPADYLVAPSRVQALVNPAGRVDSAILLPPQHPDEVHNAGADQRALDLARRARFASGSGFTIGRMIFDWHTVAPAPTNTSASP